MARQFRWELGLLGWLLCSAASAAPPDPVALAQRIDTHIEAGRKANGVTPAPRAGDPEFLRRLYLDLAGHIPRVYEAREFLDDQRPDKRSREIDKLLDGAGYVSHFSTVWRREWLPQVGADPQVQFLGPQFEIWLKKQLQANAPYDKMVRDMITAPPYGYFDGTANGGNQATAFLMANELKPENIAAATSRLFLGVKIECAQCHNHPFDTWKREQFWQFASFFAGITPVGPNFRRAPNEAIEVRSLTIPDLNKKVSAKFLDGKEPKFTEKVSSRVTLAEWMTAKENPYFARNAVNRIWANFFGTGLIDPLDEPGEQNPPSHPELLKELSKAFADSGYDLKFLIKAIVSSKAYQLSSASQGASATNDRTFSRMKVRGLTPEQLFDSLALATGYRDTPGSMRMYADPRMPRGEFLAKFSSTERLSEVQTSILQALTLMNGKLIGELTSVERSELLTGVANTPFFDTPQKIEVLYLAALSRKPTAEETRKLTEYVDKGGPTHNATKALADVFWALLNSSEFGFNH